MASSPEAPWMPITRRKQADRAALIPSHWQIPQNLLPIDPPRLSDGPQNILNVPHKVLSPEEIHITESYTVPSLLSAISVKKLSSVKVTQAFCHRAAVAQQLTNCITEPLFTQALERAKYLDKYLADNGETLGPLHGLPVSVKDTFNVKGVDTSVGLAALCYKPAESNAPLVDLLLSLGCVIIAKTNIPQTLSSLDSINNVFGRTMNPVNRLCTAGGSSGGEGVMVAMKACMVGIGTDIGGSIRIPAMCNGVYSFKPGLGRFPYGGQFTATEGMSRTSVQAVAGPLGRSMEDIDVVMREVVPRAHLWGEDCLPATWSTPLKDSGPRGELTIGILRSDGNCAPLPPINRILDEVNSKLSSASGIKVVEIPTPPAWTKCQSVMSKLLGVDGGAGMGALIEAMQEPLVPWMVGRFKKGTPQSLSRVAQLQAQRSELEREMLNLWYQTDFEGRKTRTLDAIICPVAPHPVPEIDRYNAVGYTSSWVMLDYPAGTIPVRDVRESDLEVGRSFGGKMLGSWDERNRELWDERKTDRRVYLGTKLSVQVVGVRGEDERAVRVMGVIDEVLRGKGGRAKL